MLQQFVLTKSCPTLPPLTISGAIYSTVPQYEYALCFCNTRVPSCIVNTYVKQHWGLCHHVHVHITIAGHHQLQYTVLLGVVSSCSGVQVKLGVALSCTRLLYHRELCQRIHVYNAHALHRLHQIFMGYENSCYLVLLLPFTRLPYLTGPVRLAYYQVSRVKLRII